MYEPRVNPIKIISPISGTTCMPKITEKKIGDKIYVEATWYDHASGEFLRRGLVKVLNAANRKEILAEGQGVNRYPEFNKLQSAINFYIKTNNQQMLVKSQEELRNWADSKGIDINSTPELIELLAEGQGVNRYPEFAKFSNAIRHATKTNNQEMLAKAKEALRNWADSKGININTTPELLDLLSEGQGVNRYPEFNKLQSAIRHAYKLNNIKLTLKLQDELRNWADSKGINPTANADVWELLTLNDNEATFTSDDDKKDKHDSLGIPTWRGGE